jgi:hypothetical protein
LFGPFVVVRFWKSVVTSLYLFSHFSLVPDLQGRVQHQRETVLPYPNHYPRPSGALSSGTNVWPPWVWYSGDDERASALYSCFCFASQKFGKGGRLRWCLRFGTPRCDPLVGKALMYSPLTLWPCLCAISVCCGHLNAREEVVCHWCLTLIKYFFISL